MYISGSRYCPWEHVTNGCTRTAWKGNAYVRAHCSGYCSYTQPLPWPKWTPYLCVFVTLSDFRKTAGKTRAANGFTVPFSTGWLWLLGLNRGKQPGGLTWLTWKHAFCAAALCSPWFSHSKCLTFLLPPFNPSLTNRSQTKRAALACHY